MRAQANSVDPMYIAWFESNISDIHILSYLHTAVQMIVGLVSPSALNVNSVF